MTFLKICFILTIIFIAFACDNTKQNYCNGFSNEKSAFIEFLEKRLPSRSIELNDYELRVWNMGNDTIPSLLMRYFYEKGVFSKQVFRFYGSDSLILLNRNLPSRSDLHISSMRTDGLPLKLLDSLRSIFSLVNIKSMDNKTMERAVVEFFGEEEIGKFLIEEKNGDKCHINLVYNIHTIESFVNKEKRFEIYEPYFKTFNFLNRAIDPLR
ncbi:MAG: hypothetical protein WAT19_05800 [Ferruginibacter sp.]